MEPVPCPPGHYCPPGTSSPLPCEGGTFSNKTGLSSAGQCTPTDPGFYASTGGTQQTPCAAGTVQPSAGMGSCVKCQAGTFQGSEGQPSCRICRAGSYSANVLSCELCNIGEYCPARSAVGTPCPVGSTTEGRGAESSDECGCRTGTYDSAAAGEERSCEPCNANDVDCSRTGLTLATVPLLPARWRISNRTASIYECDSSACLGGDWSGTGDGYCVPGRVGPRCEWCSDPSRYYDAETATCKDCGDLIAYASQQSGVLLVTVVVLALLRLALLRVPRLLARVSKMLAQFATRMKRVRIMSKCGPLRSNLS